MQDLKNVRRKLIDHLSWSERVELQGYKRNRVDNLLAACSPSVSCITVPNTVNDNSVKQACSYYGRVDVQIRPEPLSQFKKTFLNFENPNQSTRKLPTQIVFEGYPYNWVPESPDAPSAATQSTFTGTELPV